MPKKSVRVEEPTVQIVPIFAAETAENATTNLLLGEPPHLVPKPYILDPLSVIIKLAMLSRKPKGCKLCLLNHVVYIQEPGAFQPLVRFFFNTTKEDLGYLYNPIEIACRHFLHTDQRTEGIAQLFVMAQEGLKYLIEQYKDYIFIVHTLYLYSSIIQNYLGNTYSDSLFIPDEISKEYFDNEYVCKINEKWSEKKIKMVLDMIQYIDQEENNATNQMTCLSGFMTNIDIESKDYFSNGGKPK